MSKKLCIVSIQGLSVLQVYIFYPITSFLNIPCLTPLEGITWPTALFYIFLFPVLSVMRLVHQSPDVSQVPATGVN